MLPSRPRLQGWDPESLNASGPSVQSSGAKVHDVVDGIAHSVAAMPESKAWSGVSHDAATQMFGRAARRSQDFADYAAAVAAALTNGAGAIATARTNLLHTADEIEHGGELYVDDQWVVLVRPAEMSAEKAAELEKQAQADQVTVNVGLLAVGDADESTAQGVQHAASGFGFTPQASGPLAALTGGKPPPQDDGPNPRLPVGAMQQAFIRDQDMATSVRERATSTKGDVKTTTLTMMDGSRHVITEDRQDRSDKGPITSDTYYDKNGHEASTTSSFQYKKTDDSLSGAKVTEIQFADGTYANMIDRGGGNVSGQVITPDGRKGNLSDKFFADPIPTLAGGATSGLVKQTENGIPMLTPETVDKVGTYAKWGGPALGVAVAAFHAVTAPDAHEACVASVSGAAGVGGGVATDALVAAAFPEAAPLAVGIGNAFGSWTFGYLGGIVGNIVCPQ